MSDKCPVCGCDLSTEGLSIVPKREVHHAANALPELVEAVRVTLKENAHLADGDVCTLKSLKDALARATEVKL